MDREAKKTISSQVRDLIKFTSKLLDEQKVLAKRYPVSYFDGFESNLTEFVRLKTILEVGMLLSGLTVTDRRDEDDDEEDEEVF